MKARKNIPKRMRIAVWDKCIGEDKRIGDCYVCKDLIKIENFECGHIDAVYNNGPDDITNLKPICSLCNKSSGTINMNVFKKIFDKINNEINVYEPIHIHEHTNSDDILFDMMREIYKDDQLLSEHFDFHKLGHIRETTWNSE